MRNDSYPPPPIKAADRMKSEKIRDPNNTRKLHRNAMLGSLVPKAGPAIVGTTMMTMTSASIRDAVFGKEIERTTHL